MSFKLLHLAYLFKLGRSLEGNIDPQQEAIRALGYIVIALDSKLLEHGAGWFFVRIASLQQNLDVLIVLEGVGLDLSHVVQARVYLTQFDRDYAAMNEAYQSYFPPDRRPARTCAGVSGLAVNALVEIDMVARRPEQ